ncbi:MAG: heme lyase CcmF/NrfE family subunit [Anaerolineae bacterium]|nr:heme lyase CcmF/NrfE family subunit [Anaerolineae bacterium]
MIAEVGFIALLLSLVAAGYAAVVSLWAAGRRDMATSPNALALPAPDERTPWMLSARNAALSVFLLLSLAVGLLLMALVGGEFQMEYVYSTTERSADLFLRVAALWGAQEGSLLFWSWLMSTFAAAAILINWRSHRRFMPYVIAITMLTVGFFLFITVAYANPFNRLWALEDNSIKAAVIQPPDSQPAHLWLLPDGRSGFAAGIAAPVPGAQTDGVGMNPLLRHPGMLIHPPMLYLGFVGMVIPFAFAMAALATREYGGAWIAISRRWLLVAWMFLSLGLALGGRWAYDVLGWGGYWAWDPVENAALLPWLTGTALLHSIVIQQKRGMFKRWNMILVILTYWLVIFGTFATRSGVVNSVHSFAESPIGMPMLAFVTFVTLASLVMLASRWDGLRSQGGLAGWLSRESLFMLNNVVFVSLAVVIFGGSYAVPIISELFLDTQVTMGPPYFETTAGPLFIALFVLMALAPLSVWRSSAPERMGRAMRAPVVLTIVLMLALGLPMLGDAFDVFLALGAIIAALLTLVYHFYTYQGRGRPRELPTVTLVNVMIGLKVALVLLTVAPGASFMGFLDFAQDTLQTGALLAYSLIAFAGLVTLWEYYRGVRARDRSRGGGPFRALYNLFRLHRRRYGGYFIHLGVLMLAVGIVGSSLFQQETQQRLAPGETLTIGNYTLRYDMLGCPHPDTGVLLPLDQCMQIWAVRAPDPLRFVSQVTILRDGREEAMLYPGRDQYQKSEQTMTPPSVYHTIAGDLYVILASWGQDTATFKVYLNPLIGFVWLGAVMLAAGGLIAIWPQPKRASAEQRAPAGAAPSEV